MVVFGTYDAGGIGPTAIRSSAAVPDTWIVFEPAFSGTAIAVLPGTSGLPASSDAVIGAAPLTRTANDPAAAVVPSS